MQKHFNIWLSRLAYIKRLAIILKTRLTAGSGDRDASMQVYLLFSNYNRAIRAAKALKSSNPPTHVLYHCFWNGKLNDRHLASIRSCYVFNVHNQPGRRKIILWTETLNTLGDSLIAEISAFAEIREFDLTAESAATPFDQNKTRYNKGPNGYSDLVRCILLHNYGGLWFDLDILFLRSFDALLENMPRVFMYEWENQFYPNNAIFYSPRAHYPDLVKIFQFIVDRQRGFGCKTAQLTYDLPVPMLVLPCAWFDPGWIDNPLAWHEDFSAFFMEKPGDEITLETFFPGAFAYHWHNQSEIESHPQSPYAQLNRQISSMLDRPRQ